MRKTWTGHRLEDRFAGPGKGPRLLAELAKISQHLREEWPKLHSHKARSSSNSSNSNNNNKDNNRNNLLAKPPGYQSQDQCQRRNGLSRARLPHHLILTEMATGTEPPTMPNHIAHHPDGHKYHNGHHGRAVCLLFWTVRKSRTRRRQCLPTMQATNLEGMRVRACKFRKVDQKQTASPTCP